MVVARFVAVGIAMIALVLLALFTTGVVSWGEEPEGFATVTIAGQEFVLEISSTDEEIRRGMMDRESIDDQSGMIFVFPDYRPRRFWMKNCLVNIDLVFLDDLGRVIAMHEMFTEPPQGDDEPLEDYEDRLPPYESGKPAKFAVELQAGMVETLGVGVGDVVEFDLRRLKRLAR